MVRYIISSIAFLLAIITGNNASAYTGDGSANNPLKVILIPADGGTEDGTRADYTPIFKAVSRQTNLQFDIRVGQSYSAVVEALCNGSADIAFVGPATYIQANQRNCAELLAVGVEKGQPSYYSAIFAKKSSKNITNVKSLKGKRVAFGDINSSSSFIFPVAMIMEAGLDPARDLSQIRITGSHAASLGALTQGQVDAAALSFDSFDKAVRQGAVNPSEIKVVVRSVAIPYPPLVMNTKLSPKVKAKLKSSFSTIHNAPGVTPNMIRGYGGSKLDRYETNFPPSKFNYAARIMAKVNDSVKSAILKKASARQ